MAIVFVISEDRALRTGVRAELRELGLEALGMRTLDDAGRAVAAGDMPSAIVLEADSFAQGSPEQRAAFAMLARRAPVVLVASRTAAAPQPDRAAEVLYRPVSVGQVVASVRKLLEGTAA